MMDLLYDGGAKMCLMMNDGYAGDGRRGHGPLKMKLYHGSVDAQQAGRSR